MVIKSVKSQPYNIYIHIAFSESNKSWFCKLLFIQRVRHGFSYLKYFHHSLWLHFFPWMWSEWCLKANGVLDCLTTPFVKVLHFWQIESFETVAVSFCFRNQVLLYMTRSGNPTLYKSNKNVLEIKHRTLLLLHRPKNMKTDRFINT